MTKAVVSVADYLSLINHALRTIPSEGAVIEGEIVDFKISQGKWVMFDLKDEKAEAKICCFMTTFQLNVPLASGARVHVSGYPKVAEKWGKLSFNVQTVELVGEGALGKAYAALKAKLADEGLFDAARKRPMPRFPRRIGLITSGEAAAYGDFLRILGNRWSGVTVLHAPVHVQGQYAVGEILAAFAQFDAMALDERPDVIVLTRGGGALEDLHAFNDEAVARAVFRSRVPVVVGVGHERDESLCDFVADVRASTPSNAAERVVPDRREMLRTLAYAAERMASRLEHDLARRASIVERTVSVFDRIVAQTLRRVNELERVLAGLDPARVLSRGYAIVRSGGRIVKRPFDVPSGSVLAIALAQGTLDAVVTPCASQDKLL